jgi:hypothetical protein
VMAPLPRRARRVLSESFICGLKWYRYQMVHDRSRKRLQSALVAR